MVKITTPRSFKIIINESNDSYITNLPKLPESVKYGQNPIKEIKRYIFWFVIQVQHFYHTHENIYENV